MNIYEKLQEFDQRIKECDKTIDDMKSERSLLLKERSTFLKDYRLKVGSNSISFKPSGEFVINTPFNGSSSAYSGHMNAVIRPDQIKEFWKTMLRFFDDDPSIGKTKIIKKKKKKSGKDQYQFMDLEDE